MKKFLIAIAALLFAAQLSAQTINNLGAGRGSIVGTDLFPSYQGANPAVRPSAAQIAAYVYSLMSGSCTASGTGTISCTTTAPGGSSGQVQTNNGSGGFGGLTNAQLTALVNQATASLSGTVPAFPNTTTSYLRGDLTWQTLNFAAITGQQSGVSQLPQGIANSIFINPTGATANMQNVAVPACANDGVHALVYINGTGLQCASLTTGGAGTVTSVSAGCGTSTGGTPITLTGTVSAALAARINTATSGVGADFVAGDCGGIVYDNSSSAISASLPQAGGTGFGQNTYFARCNINTGVATITPVTSTIGGQASLQVPGGSLISPSCVFFRSDGTNYTMVEPPIGAGVAAALFKAVSTAGGFPLLIVGGTAILGTSGISPASCASTVTSTATGAALNDNLSTDFIGDPTSVTGFAPSTSGTLTIYKWVSTNTANFKVCNNTNNTVTPSTALTLTWKIFR